MPIVYPETLVLGQLYAVEHRTDQGSICFRGVFVKTSIELRFGVLLLHFRKRDESVNIQIPAKSVSICAAVSEQAGM